MKTTTKKDLATELSKRSSLGFMEAQKIMTHVVNILKDEMKAGNRIELREFGVLKSFMTKEKKARDIGRGEEVIVPPKRTVKFYMSELFEYQINHFTQEY